MNPGRFILFQVLDFVHRRTLDRLVEHYNAESRVRHFGCRQQLGAMVFAQMTWREGLRDVADCLTARPHARYDLGFREPVAKSTFAGADEREELRECPYTKVSVLLKRACPRFPKRGREGLAG